MPTGLGSEEASLLGLQQLAFLCPLWPFLYMHMDREISNIPSSSYKHTSPIRFKAHSYDFFLTLITPYRSYLQMSHTLGVGVELMNLVGGRDTIQTNTIPKVS